MSSTASKHDPYFRASISINADLEGGLRKFTELTGVGKLSPILSVLAQHPERAAQLLRPLIEETMTARAEADPIKLRKKQMAEIERLLREGKVAPEALQAAVASAVKTQEG